MSGNLFGYPNINVQKYRNEQNMQNVKSYLYEVSETASNYILQLQDQIEELQNAVNALKGES